MMKKLIAPVLLLVTLACNKGSASGSQPTPGPFSLTTLQIPGASGAGYLNTPRNPSITLRFSAPVDAATITGNIVLKDNTGAAIPINSRSTSNDSLLIIQPASALQAIAKYTFSISTGLRSKDKAALTSAVSKTFITAIDSSDKFPRISDSALLDLVQSQTLKYFYDFGHPVSGLTRERSSSGDIVTTGGSGFGIMSILAGIQRNFITRQQGLTRIRTMVNFLSTKAQRYHGAFPHWMNGATGATVPFSTQDDGADLVETAYLVQGLLSARQFFSSTTDPAETAVRDSINAIWTGVDWGWFRQNGQNTLYWHWSPNFNWSMNQTITGWNEAFITYVLAASAPVDSIPRIVYDNGWAGNGAIRNGASYFGVPLPLGPAQGGPLFFTHYSFLGINPHDLSDAYANYWTQDTAHTRINYNYCVANPQGFYGYSPQNWGLTASDDNISGYSAHSPANDLGIISPTAAISSLPYAPAESMKAIRFFYYTLGDKTWGQYGFTDAFNLSNPWFDSDCVAIDQGPQIIMIENYRSGLLWNLFMSCPEIKSGLKSLGFSSPYLSQ
ncbi:MAG TPA: glucoamylase family protein [Puia sp.]|nr:glucoamylase family protein [Puia sp.]